MIFFYQSINVKSLRQTVGLFFTLRFMIYEGTVEDPSFQISIFFSLVLFLNSGHYSLFLTFLHPIFSVLIIYCGLLISFVWELGHDFPLYSIL